MNFLIEYVAYLAVKVFAAFVRLLPLEDALRLGRFLGMCAYYLDMKHKSRAYANLKLAFSETKTNRELRQLTKDVFKNFGQSVIEILRLPLFTKEVFEKYVTIEGKENLEAAMAQGKGGIILAMHFGSWELASLACARLGFPYRVFVKQQKRFLKLSELLTSYRNSHELLVITRGAGTTRDLIKALRKNEAVAVVVDQGGRDGTLVPFFNRHASMSVGAIRLALKFGVPLCLSIIVRQKDHVSHRLTINPAFELTQTGDTDRDVVTNLERIISQMEGYIRKEPAGYMWFYKIWKYSNEATIAILSDGKTGHLRQSQAVARTIEAALAERGIRAQTKILEVVFKDKALSKYLSLLSFFMGPIFSQGRLGFLRWFLTKESYERVMSIKADFMVSCGSSIAGVNYLLSNDQQAKSVAVLKPGILGFNRFDAVVLPQHDEPLRKKKKWPLIITRGAPNLITPEYIDEQTKELIKRFPHLKRLELPHKNTIGVLLGGDTKHYVLTERQVRIVISQIRQAAETINLNILITTSRRTSPKVEAMLLREIKKHPRCELLILATRNNIPEAVGGILGLSDTVVVSGDSISMISEAAASGKHTIVFPVETRAKVLKGTDKHKLFIDKLHAQGYILASGNKDIGRTIFDIAKNKVQTKQLNDNEVLLEAVRKII